MTAIVDRASEATDRAPAWTLTILSMTSVQLGTALATGLFATVGPAGTVWLRFSAGALIFLAMRRPTLRGRPRQELVSALALGAATGWALYIVLTAHVGDRFEGLEGLSITIPIAALTAAVIGVPQAAGNITLLTLVAAVGLAVLQPVLPFSLELLALRRLTK